MEKDERMKQKGQLIQELGKEMQRIAYRWKDEAVLDEFFEKLAEVGRKAAQIKKPKNTP